MEKDQAKKKKEKKILMVLENSFYLYSRKFTSEEFIRKWSSRQFLSLPDYRDDLDYLNFLSNV